VVHPVSWPVGADGAFPGTNRPKRESDHLSESSAKVQNDGATPPLPYAFMTSTGTDIPYRRNGC
jgi:hypothetical protein